MTIEHPAAEPLFTRPFVLLTAGHFLQALGYASLILLPVWLDHLGASRSEVGVVMAAAALGGLLVRPAVAWSLDVVGRRRTLLWGTALSGLGMVAIGGVDKMGPLIVAVSAGLGTAMVLESAFSFLGVGVTPPTPSWGNMISDGLRVWTNYPHLLAAPAAVLAVVTVAFNFLGDGLNDALNPKGQK